MTEQTNYTLDPQDWEAFRKTAHNMLDDMIDHMQSYREQSVWQPVPDEVKEALSTPLPQTPQSLESAHQEFMENVLPYPLGNPHPRFWGWVIGTGTPLGAVAELLAGALNPQLGGGEHAPLYVELQTIEWLKEWLGYPQSASGVMVSGASMANLIGMTVARNDKADFDIRARGLQSGQSRMIMYTSAEGHSCHQKNVEMLGIGSDSLRFIPVNDQFQMDIDALEQAIAEDKRAGYQPICVIGTAGTVKTGAFDDLNAIADICEREDIWFHVDGAFGAFATIVPTHKHLADGMERADSLAFDMHKWMSLPFEVACTLVRNNKAHYDAFTLTPDYLTHGKRGASSAQHWMSDYSIQLSRNFRAFKVWLSLKVQGTEAFTRVIQQNCEQTQYLAQKVIESDELELTAPVPLNIVCFRYIREGLSDEELNALNEELLLQLQESGVAVTSNATIDGRYSLRMAHVNHRSTYADFDVLVDKVLELGRGL